MVIFHSYVSLPDGNYLVINGKSTIFLSKFDVPYGDLNVAGNSPIYRWCSHLLVGGLEHLDYFPFSWE